jgi:predicted transcriptional regulator
MFENVQVQQCMTHPAMTIAPSISVRVAHQIMRDYHVRHLPVVQGNRLVGILSSGDIRRAMPSSATSLSVWEIHALWDKVTVESTMSRHLITVKPDTPILEAVRLMYEHRFNSLPVLDDDEQLVGILTEVDTYLLLLQSSNQDRDVPEAKHDTADQVAALP